MKFLTLAVLSLILVAPSFAHKDLAVNAGKRAVRAVPATAKRAGAKSKQAAHVAYNAARFVI